MTPSQTQIVLLPSYNTGGRLLSVITEVLDAWAPVLVVIDGSTDGSAQAVQQLTATRPALHVLVLPVNSGKGGAVLAGAAWALARGFSHALVMDADGQHPAASIPEFMQCSRDHPEAMVLGRPVFPANIPRERLYGRQISIALVHLEVLGRAIADPLYGFRVYPLAPLQRALASRTTGRRYDFDTEAAVRICWAGTPTINRHAPVRYFTAAEGGVSHFRYLRDNFLLFGLHVRLLLELLFWRWPSILRRRFMD